VRQEVQVSVTYALDPGDTDVVRLADRKALEVTLAHEAAWNRIGAFRTNEFQGSGGRNHSGGASPGRCSGPRAANEDREADEDMEDENDAPDDRSDDDCSEDDPLAGLPHCGDDPFGGGPAPAGASRPFPAPTTGPETRNGRPAPVPGLGRESDPPPDAEPATGPQKILIRSRAKKAGLTPYALESLVYQQFRVWKVEKLTKEQGASLLDALDRDLRERDLKEKEMKENGNEGAAHADSTHADDCGHAAAAGTA